MRAAVDVSLRHAKRKEQNKNHLQGLPRCRLKLKAHDHFLVRRARSVILYCTVPSILFYSQHNRGPLLLLLLLLCSSQPEGPVWVGGGVFLLHGALGAVLAPIDGGPFLRLPLAPASLLV